MYTLQTVKSSYENIVYVANGASIWLGTIWMHIA